MNFAKLLWQRKWNVLALTLFGMLFMLLLAVQRSPLYESTITVKVKPFTVNSNDAQEAENEIGLLLLSRLNEDSNKPLIKRIIEKANLTDESDKREDNFELMINKIKKRLTIDNVLMSENQIREFDLSIVDYNKESAKIISSMLVEHIIFLQTKSSEKIEILTHCCQQTEIVAPRKGLMATFGLFAGLFIGVAITILFRKLP